VLTVISGDINSKTVFNIPKLEASKIIIVIIPKRVSGIMGEIFSRSLSRFEALAMTN
jgi:hypothetical protein